MRHAFEEHLRVVEAALDAVVPAAEQASDAIVGALRSGRRVVAFGNGGSAAHAQHLAAELVGRYLVDRRPLRAVALPTDAPTLTAIANDHGFDQVFARQLLGVAAPGDVAIALSTSGTSANVVAAVRTAADLGCVTIGLTGEGGGDLAPLVDHLVAVPSAVVPRIQEVHAIVLHGWAADAEAALGP